MEQNEKKSDAEPQAAIKHSASGNTGTPSLSTEKTESEKIVSEQNNDVSEDATRKYVKENKQNIVLSEDEAREYVKEGVDTHIKPMLEKFERDMKTDKTTLITILALFASVIMFLSSDIQILKTVIGYWHILGFSLILQASLLSFVIMIDYVSKGWINPEPAKSECRRLLIVIGVIVCIFIAGMVVSYLGN